MTYNHLTRLLSGRAFIVAALCVGITVLALVDGAEARGNNGGSRSSMGSTKSGGSMTGAARSNSAMGSKNVGRLRCEGPSCRQMGDRAQTTGTNKAEPNPTSRDHRKPNSAPGGGVTVTDNGPPRPKQHGGICAGWGCPKPRQPNKETVVNDHRSGR